MFYRNFILFICVNFIIFTQSLSDVQHQNLHLDTQPPSDASEISEENLDYEQRQVIKDKFLDSLERAKEDWVDPYDMIGLSMKQLKEQMEDKKTVSKTSSIPIVSNKDEAIVHTNIVKTKASMVAVSSNPKPLNMPNEQKPSCALDSIYVTRWVKMLLYRIEKESDKESSAIIFTLDSTIMESLRDMANAKSYEISTFDGIISNLLAQAVITRKESFTWSYAYVNYSDTLWLVIYVLSVCVVVYVIHLSFMRRPKLTLLCGIVFISVFWHWMHLYQKKKAQHHAELSSMQIPTQCKKHDLGLFEHINEYFKSFFTKNDCSKYYEALLVDPMWEVSISMAISEAVTAFLFQPLSASSRALNSFIKELFDDLPVHLTVVLIVFIFFMTLMMFNYSFSIPWISRIEPQRAIGGSQVQEVSAPRQILTEVVRNVASAIESEAILAEDSTGLSRSQIPVMAIQNNSTHDAQINNPLKDNRRTTTKVMEDELAIESRYFDARTSVQPRYSKPEIHVNATLPTTETSPKKLSFEDNSKVGTLYNANSMDVTRDVSSSNPVHLTSNNSGVNNELEVSNLPKALSDSFELLPTEDDNGEIGHCNKGPAVVPNCDTSSDNLEELHVSDMHCSCKLCK